MGYELALTKAWDGLTQEAPKSGLSVRFFGDEYTVDPENRRILSLSCNVPTKDYLSILLLHYLVRKLQGLPEVSGEWISFKQLPGGQGYYPAFKKRVLEPIARKYGPKPEALLEVITRLKAQKADVADASVVINVFDEVPVLVTVTKADEEFGPEANLLFDKGIEDIFCTEDIVIVAEFVAHHL